MITAYHLFTGPDGDSHVTKGHITPSALTDAKHIYFHETAPHSSSDWHNAPTTQYVITLAGTLEFTTRGGETFTLRPGDVLVAMDTTGTGHTWKMVDNAPWRRAYIPFEAGVDTHFVAGE